MKKVLYLINKVSQKRLVSHLDSIVTIKCLSELGYKVYCADWSDISDSLIISYVLDPSNGLEYKDVNMNNICDIVIYRSLGAIEPRIFDFQKHLLNVKEKYSGFVVNDIEAMLFGVRKDYLLFLQKNSFPVIPSKKFKSGISLEELKKDIFNQNEKLNIIKPITGECGNSFYLVNEVTQDILDYKKTKVGGWIMQPLMNEISNGEISIIMINGEVSHAVKKIPSASDLRINERWVSEIVQIDPPAEVINLAKDIYNTWPFDLLTFRLDVIKTDIGYMIMEVETVNAGFYQSHISDPEYPIRLLAKKVLI
jgi:glutathione synthase/RimK-type ligase-like ATP-grasp enzyme